MAEKPSHWQEFRSKILFKRMERPPREEDDVVTAFRDGIVTLRKNRRTEGFTNSIQEIGYQGIRKGDLVIHAMDAFAGAIGISDSDGKSTPVYSVCTPRRLDVYTPYYARLLRHMALTGFITSLAKGIRERSTEFRYKEFADLVVPLPSLPEQRAIAAFLDRETARIDALIAKQEALIALLHEKRKALISHAVTKGLDCNAPMKDSGVAWLGEMPAHWEVKRVKNISEFVTSGSRSWAEYYSDDGAAFLRAGNLVKDTLRLNMSVLQRVNPPVSSEGERTLVQIGDVLVVITGATIGSVAVIDSDLGEAYVNQHLSLIRPLQVVRPQWLGYSLLSEMGNQQLTGMMYGGTKLGLSLEDIRNIIFVLPPLLEQDEILSAIDEECSSIDALIAKAEQLIELLREHRTSLIAAAVTGKIDVRGMVE
jgi:type I restriction enzyme S subunit